MLKPHEVAEVKRLDALGVSGREIARRTGFARETVRKIISGRRPDYEALRRMKKLEVEPLFGGEIGRCSECGARVYLPCLACRVREYKKVA